MMTLWMHDGDPLWPLFLARIIVLVAAIGMGVIFFGLGAIVVRCVAAAKLWFGKRARSRPMIPAASSTERVVCVR